MMSEPKEASLRAIARPMPREAPVMREVFPSNGLVIDSLLHLVDDERPGCGRIWKRKKLKSKKEACHGQSRTRGNLRSETRKRKRGDRILARRIAHRARRA